MIDATKEMLLSFADAVEWLPRQASGKRVSTKTVARWSLGGIAGLQLETIRIGRRRVTSKEACAVLRGEYEEGRRSSKSPGRPEAEHRVGREEAQRQGTPAGLMN